MTVYEIGQERSAIIFFGSLFFFLFLSHERKKMNGRVAHAEREREREKSVVVHGMCRKMCREAYLCVRIERATLERGY